MKSEKDQQDDLVYKQLNRVWTPGRVIAEYLNLSPQTVNASLKRLDLLGKVENRYIEGNEAKILGFRGIGYRKIRKERKMM